ncbi:MAG TPA: hypothetical protein VMU36_09230 [Spirochaetia bacterium]|nr:hypothetical protein [Spirochaetia bacterium]
MKKPSEEARRRYIDYIKDYKSAIDAALDREKKVREEIAAGVEGASFKRLALADDNLNLVAQFLLMNSLSLSFLGVKNEVYLNEGRKCIYKALIALEEILSPLIDAPFSDYEQGLETIATLSDEDKYNLVRKLGFTIDSLVEGYGENSKWKWSFVELEGRFAVVAKNLLNLKTFVAGMDPRIEGFSSRMAHLGLARELLQQAADRYREKYELSTMRIDDIKAGINFLAAVRRLHIVLGESEQADVVKKKADIWRTKMENDLKKAETPKR